MDDIRLERIDDSILEMICPERIDADAMRRATEALKMICATGAPKRLLVDAIAMRSFSADMPVAARMYVKALKDSGIKEGAAATSSSAIRMIGSTIALAGGFRLKFFDSRTDALKHIEVSIRPSAGETKHAG